jgi:hypothetical protein
VLAVWGKYFAEAEIVVGEGFRLIDGTAKVDQSDIYTDTIPPAPDNAKPVKGEIEKNVLIRFQRNTTRSGEFTVTENNKAMTGTINVYFTVSYKPVK